ncbi:MAG: molybdopterin-dependent oxidoreductase [Desulfobacterota bacterium]|nr:molybdopterin-dependent oxidoreductase [Thermodesulfobacteriota bacterium]
MDLSSPSQTIPTSCARLDHGGCGLLVTTENGKITRIQGDPESPLSRGYICPKGLAGAARNTHPDRLTTPLIREGARGAGRWRAVSWEEALGYTADRLNQIRRETGPQAVVFAQGAPKGLEHFVLIRLANVFGSPNVCGPQHVCHMPRELAGVLTGGFFPVPDYDTPTSLVLNWGSNLLRSNEEGIISSRLVRSLKGGADLIVVDPRKNHLADISQSHLQIRPGSDGALALGMLRVIIEEGLYDREFVEKWTLGFAELRDRVRPYTPEMTAELTWLTPQEIIQTAWTYATSKPALMQWGNALEHTPNAFQACRALLCLMAVTGNLDVPGGNIMPAMPPVARLADFVKAALLPDKAQKMISRSHRLLPNFMVVPPPLVLQAIRSGDPYPVRAMYVQVYNPLLTCSQSRETAEALKSLDFLAAADIFMTPTAALADVVLPAATAYEFDDMGHFGLAHGWVAARPQIVSPPGRAWPDIQILSALGQALGHGEHFWPDYHQALEEVLGPSGLTYNQFQGKKILTGPKEYGQYRDGGFKTPSGQVELFSSRLEKWGFDPLPGFSPAPEPSLHFPLLATSRKNAHYFHSAYRQIEALRKKHPEPLVEIHPRTAQLLGVATGEEVAIVTPTGRIRQQVRITEAIDPRVVYIDYGWWFPEKINEELFGWDQSNINVLTAHEPMGKEMGTPYLRAFPCRVEKIR